MTDTFLQLWLFIFFFFFQSLNETDSEKYHFTLFIIRWHLSIQEIRTWKCKKWPSNWWIFSENRSESPKLNLYKVFTPWPERERRKKKLLTDCKLLFHSRTGTLQKQRNEIMFRALPHNEILKFQYPAVNFGRYQKSSYIKLQESTRHNNPSA